MHSHGIRPLNKTQKKFLSNIKEIWAQPRRQESIRIVSVPYAGSFLPFTARELAILLRVILTEAGIPNGDLELAILDDACMEQLNRQSLRLPGPTNVLSFPSVRSASCPGESSENASVFLGNMALCAPAVLRECLLYGQGLHEHTLRLLAHGVVHLLGHDHGPDMDALCERLECAGGCRFARDPHNL